MEFGFLGVILGLTAVILVRVSFMGNDIRAIPQLLEKDQQ